MIKILKNGLSPSMRYIGRTHAVSIAAMKEVIDMEEVVIEYINTKSMKADILTKGFSSGDQWDVVRKMIMTGSRSEFNDSATLVFQ